MNAIILAAGQCTRLRPHTDTTPKCLLKVGSMSILERQIQILSWSKHISLIYIVIGYKGDMIKDFVKNLGYTCVRFIENQDFMTTNNGKSLELALNETGFQPFILMNGDVACDANVVDKLLESPYRNAGACVKKDEIIPEDMKVLVESDGQIISVAKTLTMKSYGEFTGIAKFDFQGVKLMRECLKRIKQNDWFEHALQDAFYWGLPFYVVEVGEYKFIEIDTAEDLDKARRMF